MCKQSKTLSSPNVLRLAFFWRLLDLLIIITIVTAHKPAAMVCPWNRRRYVMYVSSSSRLITLFERLRINALCIPGAADAQWRDFRKATFWGKQKNIPG